LNSEGKDYSIETLWVLWNFVRIYTHSCEWDSNPGPQRIDTWHSKPWRLHKFCLTGDCRSNSRTDQLRWSSAQL